MVLGRGKRPQGELNPAWVLLFSICGVLLAVLLGWDRKRSHPKPDTAGHVEFNGRSFSARFDVPAGWRFTYTTRHAPYFNQGLAKDERGRGRLRAYMGTAQPRSEPWNHDAYARSATEGYRKAGIDLDGVEFRETPRGRCWVYRLTKLRGEAGRGKQPVTYVHYAEEFEDKVLIFDFGVPAAEAGDLLPLTWQSVWMAEVRGPDRH